MFRQKSDTRYESAGGGRKKYIMLALAGATCLFGGALYQRLKPKTESLDGEAAGQMASYLSNHHDFASSGEAAVTDLLAQENGLMEDSVEDADFSALLEGDDLEQEEEVIELTATKPAAPLMATFYDHLATGCVKWYAGASRGFELDGEAFAPFLAVVADGKQKNLMEKFAKEDFQKLKDKIKATFDKLLDAQTKIHTTLSGFKNQSESHLKDHIKDTKWKKAFEYTSNLTKDCEDKHGPLKKIYDDLVKNDMGAIDDLITDTKLKFAKATMLAYDECENKSKQFPKASIDEIEKVKAQLRKQEVAFNFYKLADFTLTEKLEKYMGNTKVTEAENYVDATPNEITADEVKLKKLEEQTKKALTAVEARKGQLTAHIQKLKK